MEIFTGILALSFSIIIMMLYIILKQKDKLSFALSQADAINGKYLELKDKNDKLKLEYAVLKNSFEMQEKTSKEKLSMLQNAKEELSKEFKLLANQIFEDKSKQFSYTHEKQFEMLLEPFRQQIQNFSSQSKEQFNEELKDRHLLKDELEKLKQLNQRLSDDAINLTKALKGENKTQGNWGEIILEKILEDSGLRKDIEYKTQNSFKSQENRTYRPDVIIHLPEKRDIVIDSKVSLVAYERYVSLENSSEKELALKQHLKSINTHIRELSSKNYEKLQGINSIDFILLFMPIEGAFLLALQKENSFYKYAYKNNIIIVSPTTLMVTLRTIEHIWKIQKQQDHANKIAKEAEAMYDKFVLFVDEMQNINAHLQKAQNSYDTAFSRLKSGKGNLIKRAHDLKELGVNSTKNLEVQSDEHL